MARPAMRDFTGRWSLVQIAAEAGVTHRVARTLVSSGYLDADQLTYRDIIRTRVAATIVDAPRPAGQTRTESSETLHARNLTALRLVEDVLDDTTPHYATLLIVTPETAQLVRGDAAATLFLGELSSAALVLPVGKWALQLKVKAESQPPRGRAS